MAIMSKELGCRNQKRVYLGCGGGGGGGAQNSEDLTKAKAWEKDWEGRKRDGGVDFACELSTTS